MKTRPYVLLLVIAVFSLPSCVPQSANPLSDPEASVQNPDLYGLWAVTQENGNVQYLHIGASAPKEKSDSLGKSVPGLMRCWLVNHNVHQNQVNKPVGMLFFASEIDGDDYANVILPLERTEQRQGPTTFLFARFRVTGDRLEIWGLDWNKLAEVIESGHLEGEVVRERMKVKKLKRFKRLKKILITDNTENIIQFLREGGNRTLFPESRKVVYERVN